MNSFVETSPYKGEFIEIDLIIEDEEKLINFIKSKIDEKH